MSRKRPALEPVPLWDEPALRSTIASAGGNPDLAPRVYRHLLSDPDARVEDVPGLSRSVSSAIAARHAAHTIRVVDVVVSGGGEAVKMLLELQDGQRVEAVVMVYDTRGKGADGEEDGEDGGEDVDEEDTVGDDRANGDGKAQGARPSSAAPGVAPPPSLRPSSAGRHRRPRARSSWGHRRATLCVSSQIGCAMACTFCATGTLGLKGNLSAGEIVEQLYLATKLQRLLERNEREEKQAQEQRTRLGNGEQEQETNKPDFERPNGASTTASDLSLPFPPALLARVSQFPAPPPLRNVVFMGMGEPLQNYEAVTSACRTMTDGASFALRRSAVTVSTVGIVPRMRTLADDVPGVSLALSLHAPNQELRKQLVPSARAYPLRKILDATDAFVDATARNRERAHRALGGAGNSKRAGKARVFYEYVLLGGVNDAPEHARELGELLRGRPATVNLIPWNPVLSPGYSYAAPGEDNARRFQSILRQEYRVPATVRAEKGQDVAAACGQLALSDLGRKRGGTCGGAKDATASTKTTEKSDATNATTTVPAQADIEDLVADARNGLRKQTQRGADELASPDAEETQGAPGPSQSAFGRARGFVRRLVGAARG